MKIIQLLPELNEGGVENHVYCLSKSLQRMGHEVTIVSAGGKMVNSLPKEIDHIKLPIHFKNPITVGYSILALSKMINSSEYDIIHAHSRVPAWVAMGASKRTQIPYAVTAHSCFGTMTPWIYKPYRLAHATICVSNSVSKHMTGLLSEKNSIIKNGVPNLDTFWNPNTPRNNFLYVGRLSRVKGIEHLLDAFAQVPGRDWSLDIVGDGPLMTKLKNMAVMANIENKVFFHGFQHDPSRFMQNAGCLLFPSLHEGMPLVLCEAIKTGIPVIASNIPSVIELTGSHPSLTEAGNISAWKDKISRIIDGNMNAPIFSKTKIPDIQQMAEQTETIYKKML